MIPAEYVTSQVQLVSRGSVEVELELEGRAVLEVVEGVVEGPAPAARRLRVQRVAARVELGALLRVRQHLQTYRRVIVTVRRNTSHLTGIPSAIKRIGPL